MDLMGRSVEMDFNAGIFVTLNPAGKGYGGRSKLPDNLKALFRSVAMAVPDNEIIAEVLLLAEGFSEAKVLGRSVRDAIHVAWQPPSSWSGQCLACCLAPERVAFAALSAHNKRCKGDQSCGAEIDMRQCCSGLQQPDSAAQQASCWPPSSGCLLVLPTEDLLLADLQEAGGAV